MIHNLQHNFTPNIAYGEYPYKKGDPNKLKNFFGGKKYIKKGDLCNSDHPFAVTTYEYNSIVNTFCEIASERFLDGRSVTLPHLGTFQPVKSDLSEATFYKTKSTRFRGGVALMLDWVKPFKRSGLSSLYSAVFHRTTFDKLNKLYNEDDAFFNKLESSYKAENNKFNKLKSQTR
jgi:hypothetical protein